MGRTSARPWASTRCPAPRHRRERGTLRALQGAGGRERAQRSRGCGHSNLHCDTPACPIQRALGLGPHAAGSGLRAQPIQLSPLPSTSSTPPSHHASLLQAAAADDGGGGRAPGALGLCGGAAEGHAGAGQVRCGRPAGQLGRRQEASARGLRMRELGPAGTSWGVQRPGACQARGHCGMRSPFLPGCLGLAGGSRKAPSAACLALCKFAAGPPTPAPRVLFSVLAGPCWSSSSRACGRRAPRGPCSPGRARSSRRRRRRLSRLSRLASSGRRRRSRRGWSQWMRMMQCSRGVSSSARRQAAQQEEALALQKPPPPRG